MLYHSFGWDGSVPGNGRRMWWIWPGPFRYRRQLRRYRETSPIGGRTNSRFRPPVGNWANGSSLSIWGADSPARTSYPRNLLGLLWNRESTTSRKIRGTTTTRAVSSRFDFWKCLRILAGKWYLHDISLILIGIYHVFILIDWFSWSTSFDWALNEIKTNTPTIQFQLRNDTTVLCKTELIAYITSYNSIRSLRKSRLDGLPLSSRYDMLTFTF